MDEQTTTQSAKDEHDCALKRGGVICRECDINTIESLESRSLAPSAKDWVEPMADALCDMETRKDVAYLERSRVVAALAKVFPSGIGRTNIPGWSPDWHGVVYIDLPTGQASWHFHDSHAFLFEGLPPYAGIWDGHTTDQKYARLAALSAASAQERREAEQYRWWRSHRQTTLIVSLFGNGCTNRTIEDVESAIDAALSQEPKA